MRAFLLGAVVVSLGWVSGVPWADDGGRHANAATQQSQYRWHTFYGSDYYDYADAVATDGLGNVYVAGQSANPWLGDGGAEPLNPHSGGSSPDLVVLKLGASGAYRWHTFYGSTHAYGDVAGGVSVDGAGNVYLAGSSSSEWSGPGLVPPLHPFTPGSGTPDIAVVALAADGDYRWHTFYGSSNSEWGRAVTVSSAGEVVVAGESFVTWNGDEGQTPLHPLPPVGGGIFALKLAGDSAAATIFSDGFESGGTTNWSWAVP